MKTRQFCLARTFRAFSRLLLATCLFAATTNLQAATIILNPSQDTFVKSSSVSANFNGSKLEVQRLSGSANFSALTQFDLSSIASSYYTITSARLEFYDTATSPSHASAFSAQASLLTPKAGKTDAEITLLNGNSAGTSGTLALDKFGMRETAFNYRVYSGTGIANNWTDHATTELNPDLPAGNAEGYFSTANALQSSLDIFNTQKEQWGFLLFSFYGGPTTSAGYRIFEDKEAVSGTRAPRLVLEVIPEPSTFILAGAGLVGLTVAARRKKSIPFAA